MRRTDKSPPPASPTSGQGPPRYAWMYDNKKMRGQKGRALPARGFGNGVMFGVGGGLLLGTLFVILSSWWSPSSSRSPSSPPTLESSP